MRKIGISVASSKEGLADRWTGWKIVDGNRIMRHLGWKTRPTYLKVRRRRFVNGGRPSK